METGVFRRLGGAQDIPSDVRILAGTSQDLAGLVQQGKFRSELFYRLTAFTIHAPALNTRRQDIAALATHFMATRAFQRGVEKKLTPEALRTLSDYSWPGNVRELRNTIERGLIMSGTSSDVGPEHLSIGLTSGLGGAASRMG